MVRNRLSFLYIVWLFFTTHLFRMRVFLVTLPVSCYTGYLIFTRYKKQVFLPVIQGHLFVCFYNYLLYVVSSVSWGTDWRFWIRFFIFIQKNIEKNSMMVSEDFKKKKHFYTEIFYNSQKPFNSNFYWTKISEKNWNIFPFGSEHSALSGIFFLRKSATSERRREEVVAAYR